MQRSEHDPEDGATPTTRESDVPPVGQPLVRSRRRAERGAPAPAGPTAAPAGPLAGRVGLVAGATSALGTAFGAALTERGARVCLLDRDLPALRALAERLGGTDATMVLAADPSSPPEVASVMDFLERTGVRPDLVVHTPPDRAGSEVDGDQQQADDPPAELDRRYRSELRAPLALAGHLAPLLDAGAALVLLAPDEGAADDTGPARMVAAARRELVEVVRAELGTAEVRVVSVEVRGEVGSGGNGTEAVAELAVDLLLRPPPTPVTHLSVDLGGPARAPSVRSAPSAGPVRGGGSLRS